MSRPAGSCFADFPDKAHGFKMLLKAACINFQHEIFFRKYRNCTSLKAGKFLYLHSLKFSPMRFYLLLLAFIICNNSFAQLNNDDNSCREKCSRASLHARHQQASYYQYPSMDKYDVKYLKLDLSVEPGDDFISGTALTVAKVLQPLDSFNIELMDNMTLDSVHINGVTKSFSRGVNYVFVPLIPSLPAGSTVSALFYYHGNANNGVYAGTNASSGLTYTATLSESYQAREWFPAKQILKDKIDSADIWVKTSVPNLVGSNGLLVAVVDSPNNKKQYQWRSRHMIELLYAKLCCW